MSVGVGRVGSVGPGWVGEVGRAGRLGWSVSVGRASVSVGHKGETRKLNVEERRSRNGNYVESTAKPKGTEPDFDLH